VATPRISVIVPAYNEARGIAATVSALRDTLAAHEDGPFEVLVVDNASEDGTAAAVERLADGEYVQLLRNERNRGKGYSVRRGMLAARGDLRLHCDADCAASLASLPRMLELIDDADVVVGSRLAEGARLGQRQPLLRRIVGRSFVLLCRGLLAEPTTDLYCGFKLWRGPVAEEVFTRIHLDGWTFDAEALAMARALGFRLCEVGIVWTDREGSRLSMTRVLVPVVRELLAARRHVRREARRPSAALAASAAETHP
jgi:dolichyl-phosphate beta-glucosyltransferase